MEQREGRKDMEGVKNRRSQRLGKGKEMRGGERTEDTRDKGRRGRRGKKINIQKRNNQVKRGENGR